MPYTVLDQSTAAAAPVTTAGNPLTSVGETLLSFRTELIAALQGRTDVSATRLNLWINRAYRHASFMVDLRCLWSSVSVSVVANQPFYLLPSAVAWIKRLVVEDSDDYFWDGGREWAMIDEPTYRNLPDSTNLTGILTRSWFPYGNMFVVWPTPQDAFTAAMDFRVRVADMTADTNSPLLPPEFHEGISLLSVGRAQRALGMRAEGNANWNDGLSVIRSTINTDAEERNAMHMTMTPVTNASQLIRARG